MNEKLALDILTRIQNGMQGQNDIKTDLKSTVTYFNLKDQEFIDTINELKEHDCIRLLSGGRPKHFIISPDKNCIELYAATVNKQNTEITESGRITELTLKNLTLQNEVLELEKKELKRKVWFGIIGFIAGAIMTNIKDIL